LFFFPPLGWAGNPSIGPLFFFLPGSDLDQERARNFPLLPFPLPLSFFSVCVRTMTDLFLFSLRRSIFLFCAVSHPPFPLSPLAASKWIFPPLFSSPCGMPADRDLSLLDPPPFATGPTCPSLPLSSQEMDRASPSIFPLSSSIRRPLIFFLPFL